MIAPGIASRKRSNKRSNADIEIQSGIETQRDIRRVRNPHTILYLIWKEGSREAAALFCNEQVVDLTGYFGENILLLWKKILIKRQHGAVMGP